ncbi:MAG TPA: septal ring lytic transglycosylase RlpA family protein, partial [Alphaproteobacteria bacterium]|nr:septal ring lytic transglycosylase RlpA family protein [Alphaproteobacteria bacterium]
MPSIFQRGAAAARLLLVIALVAPMVAACSGAGVPTVSRAAFKSSEYGVAVSPRVTSLRNPRHGGGRRLVGEAYVVHGRTYTPMANPVGYSEVGEASWYGADFHGRLTANGEIFNANAITGAHPTLPLPCYARVTDLDTGRSIIVRVNDRGPYLPGRIMDLSYRAAAMLGFAGAGTGKIRVQYIGPAPLEGDDTRMLLASYNRITAMDRQPETRIAMASPDQAPAPLPVDRPAALSVAQSDPSRINFADYTAE